MSLRQPLRFDPLFFEKVWGGRALESHCEDELPPGPIGEIWNLADRDGATSQVATGEFAGRTLRGLMMSEAESLMGKTKPAEGGYFPLLIKLLDAGQNLSVQVHPDDSTAKRLMGGASGKAECWYVLSAEEGGRIYLGLKDGITAATFAAEAATAHVVDMLEVYPVKRGQFIYVPPGTVHAIGAGVALIEIQENSDTTYRLFDWGRVGLDGQPREIHIDEGLKSIDYERKLSGPIDVRFEDDGELSRRAKLLECDSFTVELRRVASPMSEATNGRACVYVVVEGHGQLVVDGQSEPFEIGRGQTWLLPADLGEYRLESLDGELEVLKVDMQTS